MTAAEHYVYVHRRATDGKVFYIGKGKRDRAQSRTGRNRWWHHIHDRHGRTVEIVRRGMHEPCALSLERILISLPGLRLANLTDGGGGATGWRHSDDAKRRIGEGARMRVPHPNSLAALARCNQSRVFTDDYRAKMSAAAKARMRVSVTAETRAKISASHMGIKPSDETREKLRLSHLGKNIGRDSPSYDHTIRQFTHKDGRSFNGIRGDFIIAYGLGNSCVSAVITGHQKSVKGWRLL